MPIKAGWRDASFALWDFSRSNKYCIHHSTTKAIYFFCFAFAMSASSTIKRNCRVYNLNHSCICKLWYSRISIKRTLYYYYYFYSYTRNGFYWVTFKLENIHRPKFWAITFFICHCIDFGNGECRPRIGLFTSFKNKFQQLHLVYITYMMDINST